MYFPQLDADLELYLGLGSCMYSNSEGRKRGMKHRNLYLAPPLTEGSSSLKC